MGASFAAGIVVSNNDFDKLPFFVMFLWPVPLVMALEQLLIDIPIFRRWWDKTINWYKNRKEDKLFYEKHLDNKFERSGIKFDEKGDILR